MIDLCRNNVEINLAASKFRQKEKRSFHITLKEAETDRDQSATRADEERKDQLPNVMKPPDVIRKYSLSKKMAETPMAKAPSISKQETLDLLSKFILLFILNSRVLILNSMCADELEDELLDGE